MRRFRKGQERLRWPVRRVQLRATCYAELEFVYGRATLFREIQQVRRAKVIKAPSPDGGHRA